MFKYILLGIGCFIGCLAYKTRKEHYKNYVKRKRQMYPDDHVNCRCNIVWKKDEKGL